MTVVPAEEEWTENRPSRGFPGLGLTELWSYRELAGFLALRDIKVRYKQAAFGAGWAIVQPLAAAAVYTIVFRRLARVPSEGVPYPVFAFVGAVAWSYLSSTVDAATQSVVGNAALVRKIYFPRILAPVAAMLPGLVDLGFGLVTLAVVVVAYTIAPTWALLALPLCVFALVLVALGVGLWLAALNVRYRDVTHAAALLVQVWLFISPVAYPSSLVTGGWRYVYALNPMTGVIDAFRWSLLGRPWPGVDVGISLVCAVCLFIGGVVFFRRGERSFADVI